LWGNKGIRGKIRKNFSGLQGIGLVKDECGGASTAETKKIEGG